MNSFPTTSGSQAGGMPSHLSQQGETIERQVKNIELCFSDSIQANFQNAMDHQAPIAAVMVALAAIDFLAAYYLGKEAGANGYEAFVDEYIKPLAPIGSQGYVPSVLYRNLRSGLFHSYTTAKTPAQHFQKSDIIYVLTDCPQAQRKHLKLIRGGKNRVLFHIQTFFDHVIRAKDQYFSDIENDDTLKTRFSDWYKEASHLCEIDISQL